MLGKLLILFIAVPLIEMMILVRIGTLIGFWPTIGLVLATGTVGAILARSQGLRVLHGIRAELAVGQVPTSRLLDGLMVLIGGIVLLTPGILTDILGLALLIPFTRRRLKEVVRVRLERMVKSGEVRVMRIR